MAGIISYIPWNVLNFAAGIAPITKWTSVDTKEMENYPRDDMFAKMIAGEYNECSIRYKLKKVGTVLCPSDKLTT